MLVEHLTAQRLPSIDYLVVEWLEKLNWGQKAACHGLSVSEFSPSQGTLASKAVDVAVGFLGLAVRLGTFAGLNRSI